MKIFVLLIITICSGALHAQEFWEKSDTSFNESIFDLIINDSGHIFAGTSIPPSGTTGGVFRSKDNGDSWTEINNGLSRLLVRSLAINNSGHLFAGTDANGIYRSLDNGENWVESNAGLTNVHVNTLAINDNGFIFAGTDSGLFRSDDNGATWIKKINGLTSRQILSFAINSRGVIFAGAGTTFGEGIYRSVDNGETWIKISGGFSILFVPSLVINSEDDIFAGTNRGLIRSTDDGNSWEAADSGVAWAPDIRALAINSNGDLFVKASSAFYSGVYRSVNNGESWEELFTNFIDAKQSGIFTFNSNGKIFAGTRNGVFRSLETTTNIKEFDINLPSKFSLSQNYPNPFNPITTIEYDLAGAGEVSLIIYNLKGEEVTRLIVENQDAGYHKVTWDASSLASGIYFYRLQAGDLVQTRKMVLLK